MSVEHDSLLLPAGAAEHVLIQLYSPHSDPCRRLVPHFEALAKRLENYHAQTVPILEHYEPSGAVNRVDANADPKKVWERVEAIVDPFVSTDPEAEALAATKIQALHRGKMSRKGGYSRATAVMKAHNYIVQGTPEAEDHLGYVEIFSL